MRPSLSTSGTTAPGESRRGLLTAVPLGVSSITSCDRGKTGSGSASSTWPRQQASGSNCGAAAVGSHRRWADRTSTKSMRANQLRLWLASMAYLLLAALRRIGLVHTGLAQATCGTIRLKILKIGAVVARSGLRIKIAMSSACPDAATFRVAHARLSP